MFISEFKLPACELIVGIEQIGQDFAAGAFEPCKTCGSASQPPAGKLCLLRLAVRTNSPQFAHSNWLHQYP